MTAYSTAVTRYEVSPFERSDAIRKVVILDGVTSIASFAFLNCTNLTAVSLPDCMQGISLYIQVVLYEGGLFCQ